MTHVQLSRKKLQIAAIHKTKTYQMKVSSIEDNAVTSSIRIAYVFPELVGKKTHAALKVYVEMIKYFINYTLY